MGISTETPSNGSAQASADLELTGWQVTPGEARHGDVAVRAANQEGAWAFREAGSTGEESDYIGVLTGHFSVFNRWTEINNHMEGNFMERIAPGAFSKTFSENRKGMRVLFNHGKDVIGNQPLGPILGLDQDETGAAYEVGLLDTSYNRDLLPGLQHGLYGASFRFQVLRENVIPAPARAEHNPHGIEERTMTELRVREFGPVTFGQYEEATAGIRSLNEELFDLDMAFRSMNPDQTNRFMIAMRSGVNVDTVSSREPDEVKEEAAGEVDKPAADSSTETESHRSEEDKKDDAPSEEAPPKDFTKSGGTLPKSAARLRTSRDPEEPKWKL